MSSHSLFNRQFGEFLGKLKLAIPDANELWTYHDVFTATCKANPQASVGVFLNTTHPFSKQIFEKDEQYFLRHDKIDGSSTQIWGKYWDSLSQVSQEALWGYLQNLIILSYSWVGVDTFNKDVLRKVINESPRYIPEKMDNLADFPELKGVLSKRYC